MTKAMNNIKSTIGIIFLIGGTIFGYGAFHAHSQNVKEKVEQNTKDIAMLKESIQDLLLIVQLEKQDKAYVKKSIARIEKNMGEMKQDVKEILLAK